MGRSAARRENTDLVASPGSGRIRRRFVFLLCFAFVLIALAFVFVVGMVVDEPVSHLTRDPVSVAGFGSYIGMLSMVGVILWASAAAICFFGASQLFASDRRSALFLLSGGMVGSILTLDDALLLHEQVLPGLGVPEILVSAVLGALPLLYLGIFYRDVMRTDYPLLAVSAGCFGVMLVLDLTIPMTDFGTFVEDGFKFSGIVFWLAYFSSTASNLTGGDSPSGRVT